jgi:ankyrin repeat protein
MIRFAPKTRMLIAAFVAAAMSLVSGPSSALSGNTSNAFAGGREGRLVHQVRTDKRPEMTPEQERRLNAKIAQTMKDAEEGGRIRDIIIKSDLRKLKQEIKRGLDPNRIYPFLGSPMLWASGDGDIKMLEALVEAGGNINQELAVENGDTYHEITTPFLNAAAVRSPEFLKRMVELKADFTAKGTTLKGSNEKGGNAFHSIVDSKNVAIVPLLVSLGLDINDIDPVTKMTPLTAAILHECRECIATFLDHGADPYLKRPDVLDAWQTCKRLKTNVCDLFKGPRI